MLEYFRYT